MILFNISLKALIVSKLKNQLSRIEYNEAMKFQVNNEGKEQEGKKGRRENKMYLQGQQINCVKLSVSQFNVDNVKRKISQDW